MKNRFIRKMIAIMVSVAMVISSSLITFANDEIIGSSVNACVAASKTNAEINGIENVDGSEQCLTKNEMIKIVDDMVSSNEDSVSLDCVSIDDVADVLDHTEGITYNVCEEKVVAADYAVDKTFDKDYSFRDADNIITREENGIKYTIETYNTEEGNFVRVYSDDGKYMSNIEVVDNAASVESYAYNDDINCYNNQSIYFECDEEVQGTDSFTAQAIKYGTKTKSAEWKSKTYWYQTGANGKKTYLKIGQTAQYRIRTDNLSNAKDKKCESYKSAVKKSKSYYTKGVADISGTSFTVGFIVGIIIANAACPPTVLIDLVIAAIGGGSIALAVSGVKNLVNSFEKWQDARDYYATIKTYGTKL